MEQFLLHNSIRSVCILVTIFTDRYITVVYMMRNIMTIKVGHLALVADSWQDKGNAVSCFRITSEGSYQCHQHVLFFLFGNYLCNCFRYPKHDLHKINHTSRCLTSQWSRRLKILLTLPYVLFEAKRTLHKHLFLIIYGHLWWDVEISTGDVLCRTDRLFVQFCVINRNLWKHFLEIKTVLTI